MEAVIANFRQETAAKYPHIHEAIRIDEGEPTYIEYGHIVITVQSANGRFNICYADKFTLEWCESLYNHPDCVAGKLLKILRCDEVMRAPHRHRLPVALLVVCLIVSVWLALFNACVYVIWQYYFSDYAHIARVKADSEVKKALRALPITIGPLIYSHIEF